MVRSLIEPDTEMDDSIETPFIVIDEKNPWKNFDKILMTFERFNFKLQIYDPNDEMD